MPVAFAERIHAWRLSLKLRQKEAAAIFDIPVCTYRSWENGKKTPRKLTMFEIERRMAKKLEEPQQ